MSRIQGEVLIKKELINTIPKEWTICKNDFEQILKKMSCCIEGCEEQASEYELPLALYNQASIKATCSHHQVCLVHATKYNCVHGTKRASSPSVAALPPEKKKAEDEDTVTESNQQHNDTDTDTDEVPEQEGQMKEEVPAVAPTKEDELHEPISAVPTEAKEEIKEENKTENTKEVTPEAAQNAVSPAVEVEPKERLEEEQKELDLEVPETEAPPADNNAEPEKEEGHCYVSECASKQCVNVPILSPIKVFVCNEHLEKIIGNWRLALLQHQVVLNDECLAMVKEAVGDNQMHPLYNYVNPTQNDSKCALCCGLSTSNELYPCHFCPFTFCDECYKRLCLTLGTPQQFLSNKNGWKCFACSNSDHVDRDVFIKQQLEILLHVIDARLKDGCVIGKSADEQKEFVDSIN